MGNNFDKNDIGLSEDYAAIFASIYGNQEETADNEVSSSFAASEDNSSNPFVEGYASDYPQEDPPSYYDSQPMQDYPDAEYSRQEDVPYYAQDNSYVGSQSEDDYQEDDRIYDEDEYEYDEDYDEDEHSSFPSSFKDYVGAKITGTIFRIRGGVSSSSTSSTVYDDEDVLGREVSPKYASSYYENYIYSLIIRLRISQGIMALMIYFSLSLPVPGMLKNPEVMSLCLVSLLLLHMLVCLDVFTNGITNMFSANFGADSLASLSCIVALTDVILMRISGSSAHIPLCVISGLSLLGVLYSSFLSTRGIRKALRVPTIAKRRYTVTGEQGVVGHDITLLKSTRPIIGFVRRIEEEPIDENVYKKVSPIILALSLALTFILVFVKKDIGNAFYIFALIFVPAVPITSLLCFALPFYVGSKRIFSSGAAIAGWSGACDLGNSKNLIVTDRDLFPEGSIEIENVRIFADFDSKKVISYAAAMIKQSDSALVPTFESLMKENYCQESNVDSFEILQGGGFKGLIDGHVVVCGSTDLMRLMDVRLPFRLISQRTVLLAIDGVLFGIFNLKYLPNDDVRSALVNLMRSNRHPVFATRDFNITPDMIKDVFDVATDGYDFPPYADRFPISEAKPAHDSKIAAVIGREGLGPLTAMADTGRSVFVISRLNTVLSVLSAFIAPILVFLMLLTGKTFGIGLLLLYYLISTIPIVVLGITTNASK